MKILKRFYVVPVSVLLLFIFAVPAFAAGKTNVALPFSQTGNSASLRNPAYDHERYFSATTLSGSDLEYRSSCQYSAANMGYSTAQGNLWPAIDIYNNLPYNAINIIHGHGAPGYVRCDINNSGGWTGLYSYDGSSSNPKDGFMYRYASTSLQRTKLILFIACNSASYNRGQSMATIAFQRGAKFSLGFNNSVAGGGEWNANVMSALAAGLTIQQSLDQADKNYRSSHTDAYTNPSSPVGHHLHYGKSNVTIKL